MQKNVMRVLLALTGSLAMITCHLLPWNITDCPITSASCRPDYIDEGRCEPDRMHFCDENGCDLRIAIILPKSTKYIVNAPQAMHELHSAEEYARSTNLLPDRINVTYKVFDDDCKQEFSTISAVDASSQFCAHVIIGPICDYSLASSARVAKFLGNYGTPLITPGGFSFDFTNAKTSCADEFFMLVNTGIADFQSFSEFFYHTLLRHNWTRFALMYEKYDQNELGGEQSCQLLMKSILETTKTQSYDVVYHDGDIHMLKDSYEKYLRTSVGVKFGIIVMCMNQFHTRQVMLEAETLGMIDRGEYVFFNFDMYTNGSQPWLDPNDTPENNERARRAYKALLTFTPLIEAQNIEKPLTSQPGQVYLDGIYDGFLLYVNAIQDYLKMEDWSNISMHGVDVFGKMLGHRFRGKRNGEIVMNCNGQRNTSYALMQLNTSDHMQIVAEFSTLDKVMRMTHEINWISGVYPPDVPTCGFDNSKCHPNLLYYITLGGIFLIALVLFGYTLYSKHQLELDLAADTWKIASHELEQRDLYEDNSKARQSMKTQRPDITYWESGNLDIRQELKHQSQPKCQVRVFQKMDVVVKFFKPEIKIEVGREERRKLKQMKELSHGNLAKFYGACLEIDMTCIVTEFCVRGSLMDVLEDEEITLDTIFKISMMLDIVLGMEYLHGVDITHGSLKSTNCLIDGRFAVKIADFGLDFIRQHPHKRGASDESTYSRRLLWTAPEILRSSHPWMSPSYMMKNADVYAFGIILHEILKRKGPFHLENNLTAKEIIDRVKRGPDVGEKPLRPHVDEFDGTGRAVTKMMKECWAEDSNNRPDFAHLKNMIREINRDNGNNGNLMDNLLNRMEMYANNLESLVLDRTTDFLAEKKKCEDLLYQLLPKSVASQLISGQSVLAETFDQVTICFSDIVEFTKLSAVSTPLEVIDLLNDLYTTFDEVIGDFKVYKVETIGDAYMVVSGLPERIGNRHASEIARMSLRLMETVRKFKIRHKPEEPLKLRIGLHTGSCVAGVVGLKMPRYCLFGDTVNTASRMESSGLPLKIHVSADTKCVLEASSPPSFELECRGEIDIKGKGKMTTYWLIREVEGDRHSTSFSSRPISQTTLVNNNQVVATNGTNAGESCANNKQISSFESDETRPLLGVGNPPA